ncbi:hypothetical protein [Streptomyces nanshensis]|uniref:Uncharacterized protein n=1 Tax=Streptomyces nanshensis TaxID=518642 RepID=A0A1E7LBZ6_9ACTN|nr:hypothetical protein [Streptomyces nanshensis]OEV13749.1 hypothetical protein AN218_02140 [Streptomyces nanshensis]
MAKADRNTRLRSRITGENNNQARQWLREHGLTHGAVPDAEDPQQQVLEAALLIALARCTDPLAGLETPDTLFGIAKATPSAKFLTLWPAAGVEAEVLARLLPSRAPDGDIRGVPGLGWAAVGRYLHLSVPGHAGRVLVGATARDAGTRDIDAAHELVAEAGLEWLADQATTPQEEAAWRNQIADLESAAPAWSRALRRPRLALAQRAEMARQAPSMDLLADDEDALQPRPHGPAAYRAPRVVHVRSHRGGNGSTVVSMQLACGLAGTGARVALVTDDAVVRQEAPGAPLGEDWHTVDLPSGSGQLQVASAGMLGDDMDQRAAEALQRGDLVILDLGRWRTRGLPKADLTLAVGRHVHWDWTSTDVIDRRPVHVQTYDRLDELFTADRGRPPAAGELEALLAALDSEFLAFALGRLYDADHGEEAAEDGADFYDPQDAEDVEEWWARFNRPRLNPEDILPAEDAAPLAQWRRELLEAIDAEGHRRYPGVWEEAREIWPEHNRRRNLQRLGTDGQALDDLVQRLDSFLARLPELDENPKPVSADECRAWCQGRVFRWLDERFAAHLKHDAGHLPRSDADRLLSLLDARFLPDIPSEVLDREPAEDWWWDVAGAARWLDTFGPDPFGPDGDDDLPEERVRFLSAVDAEGLRRHPGTWPQVRECWAGHHAELTAKGRRPFEPAPEQLPALRRAFTTRLHDAGAAASVPDWETVAQRWVAQERTDAERVEEFADLLEHHHRPADADHVAAALERDLHVLRLNADAAAAIVVNLFRADSATQSADAVSEALASRGIAGVCTVPQRRLLEPRAGGFGPASWSDRRVRDVQHDLATLALRALKTGTGTE